VSPGNRRIGTQQEKPSFAVESAPAEEPVVTGLWQQVDAATGKTEGWFLFVERDGLFEGRIAKMFIEPADDPNPRVTVARVTRRRPRFCVSRSSMECGGTVSNTKTAPSSIPLTARAIAR
jgi:hypothetical protein